MIAQIGEKRLWCQVCGYTRKDPQAMQILQTYVQSGGKDLYGTGFSPGDQRSGMSAQQAEMLDEAWQSLQNGDAKTARFLAFQVADRNHRAIEAYYILYLTTPKTNSMEKARHLASVLALNPRHEQARAALEKLKSVVGEGVKPSFTTVFDHREFVDETVQAQGALEVCPMCGGKTLYVEEDHTKCLSCNYRPHQKPQADGVATLPPDGGFRSLQEALWKRKYGGNREWMIARRVLACQNCGAQLTLSGNMMADQCAFCDSQHVLVRDALGAFLEPDAVLPARLSAEEAMLVKREQLPRPVQEAVYRQESVGVFLPYWNFKRVGHKTGMVLVPGGKEPSVKVLEYIQPFFLDDLRPYDQRYLARWSAQLYTIDMIQASLYADANDPASLTYRLLLLPVWMTTFHLRGGGYYHSVINAQTGEVVITDRVDSGADYQPGHAPTGSVIKPLPPRPQSVIKPLPRR